VPPHATIRTERAVLYQSVEQSATTRGLRIVRSDPASGVVVAVSPLQDMDGLFARERWRFQVSENQVQIELHPETRDADARRWTRTEFVCDCYRYAREREMLRDIRRRARRARRAAREQMLGAVDAASGSGAITSSASAPAGAPTEGASAIPPPSPAGPQPATNHGSAEPLTQQPAAPATTAPAIGGSAAAPAPAPAQDSHGT
jgi:hypothetical protein